jgi:hypothetical protein
MLEVEAIPQSCIPLSPDWFEYYFMYEKFVACGEFCLASEVCNMTGSTPGDRIGNDCVSTECRCHSMPKSSALNVDRVCDEFEGSVCIALEDRYIIKIVCSQGKM